MAGRGGGAVFLSPASDPIDDSWGLREIKVRRDFLLVGRDIKVHPTLFPFGHETGMTNSSPE
jgi:hypothetical protein